MTTDKRASRRDRRALWGAVMVVTTLSDAFFACGGTNGLEGIPQPSGGGSADAMASDTGSTVDSTVAESGDANTANAQTSSVDAGFDADIEYADAARLDVMIVGASLPGDAGDAGAAEPWDLWPPCGLDVAILDDAGDLLGEAPDTTVHGSVSCATYSWFPTYSGASGPSASDGGITCDECLRANGCGLGSSYGLSGGIVPPCSDLRDAGMATIGSGAGEPFFALCGALFECVEKTNCVFDSHGGANGVSNCYCGAAQGMACLPAGAANGQCLQEIENAYQAVPSTSATTILEHLTDLSQAPSYAAAEVMATFACALTATSPRCGMCFPPVGPDGG